MTRLSSDDVEELEAIVDNARDELVSRFEELLREAHRDAWVEGYVAGSRAHASDDLKPASLAYDRAMAGRQ
jgi:hypothetical protein